MAKKRFGPEQVVTKLRQIEVLMGEGQNISPAAQVQPSPAVAKISRRRARSEVCASATMSRMRALIPLK